MTEHTLAQKRAIAIATAKAKIGGGATAQPDSNPLWGGIDQFSSGIWQGLGDEIKAATSAAKESFSQGGLPFGEAYSQALPQYQRARKAYREANPILAPTLDIGGSMVPWIASAGLIPPMAQGASMAQKIVQGAKIGAPIGAVSGGLQAEGDIGDRLSGAGVGASAGGVLGAAAPKVLEGAIGLGKGLINQVVSRLPFQQRSMAARKIAEALARDGLTPNTAAAKLQEMGPNASILDLGPNTRALAGAAQQTPGEGKKAISDFLIARQEGTRGADKVLKGGQVNRITGQIEILVPEQFGDTKTKIELARKAFGKNYNAAREGQDLVDVSPLLKDLSDDIAVSKGGIKTALKKIQSLIVDEKGRPEITIDSLHQAKMAIDELMSGEAKFSMGKIAKAKIRYYQNALIGAIEEAGKSGAAYKAGRLGTRGEWMKQEALDLGTELMSGGSMMGKATFQNPEELKAVLSKMSPDELRTFRIGAAQALKQKIGDLVNRADATKKLMDIPALEQKIKAAFGTDETFRKYITSLEGEKEMFKSYAMMGGSQTAEREAAKADAVVDPSRIISGLARFKSPNPLDWVGGTVNILGGAKDRLMMPAGMSQALGWVMTGRSVAPLQAPYRAQGLNKKMIEALSKRLSIGGGVYGSPLPDQMNQALGGR